MKKGILPGVFIFMVALSFWISLSTGCANIIPPSGGPRDSIPPRILDVDPPDSTVNFRGKRITISFDEYVDLKDVSNNLFFTPTFENVPKIAVRARSIVIPFSDSLEPNTTYVLNFGNAIVDMNEGNVLQNFTYTFSTGPALDSLEINGKVFLAETGGTDTTLLAVLYRDLSDSAVVNKRAPYITRVDRQGNFRFRYLPRVNFAIYILGGDGKNRRYNEAQFFGFADTSVLAGQQDSVIMYAYKAAPKRAAGQAPTRIPAEDRRLRFTTSITGQQDLLQDFYLNFPVPLRSFDSTQLRLYTDSTFNPVPFAASLDSTGKQVTIKTNWIDSAVYNLVLDSLFAMDTVGRRLLATDTIRFSTKKIKDYGDLSIRLRNLDLTRNPVLQFVQSDNVVLSVP
ncbi:MAG: Ig-like domain-containing protein, partial [Flavisolibacter sp.]